MNETTPCIRCPAKVNLTLRVLRRRSDGYHELDTLFQAIDLWDEIRTEPHDDLLLDCDLPGLSVGPDNLVLKAARLVLERAGRRRGARFRLSKAIPAGAGLGGGSSDAAGALKLCTAIWDLTFPEEEMMGMARRLGADVPFFLVGGTARGRERGDRVEPLPFFGQRPILLGIPPFPISTAEVFSRVAERLTLPRNGVSLQANFGLKWNEHNDFSFMVNDLERVVFPRWPKLQAFRDALLGHGARAALLSGSGSTVFGVFDDDAALPQIAAELRERYGGWSVVTTRAVAEGAHWAPPTRG